MSAIRNQEEKQHHLQFLKEATKVWHNHGLLVSVPLHVQQELPQWAYDSLDRINLMVYDSPPLPEGTVEKWGNHVVRVAHAHHALKILVETGCPAHKIWLGIPFYGQQWDPPKKVQTYDEVAGRVMHEFKNAGVELNDLTYSPLVEMVGRFEGYQWDTPSVIIEKMSYVHTRALGGVFIWELGQDLRTRDAPAGVILTGMSAVAKRRDWRFVVDDRTQEEHMKEYMNIKAREMLLERRKEKEEAARNEKEDAARNEL
jgi:GH18 family chitinase